jgi:hypothetical protein
MQRIGFCLCLAAAVAALAGAEPSAAQQPAPQVQHLKLVAPAPSRPQPAKTPTPPAQPLGGNPTTSDMSAIPADVGQCRQACAHTYYFCLAGQDAESCPESWTSCLTACNQAPIQP